MEVASRLQRPAPRDGRPPSRGIVHVVERVGRFHRVADHRSGALVPVLERVAAAFSVRDERVRIPRVRAQSADKAPVAVAAVVVVRVVAPRVTAYAVDDADAAARFVAAAALRAAAATLTAAALRSDADLLADTARERANEAFVQIGMNCSMVHISALRFVDPRGIRAPTKRDNAPQTAVSLPRPAASQLAVVPRSDSFLAQHLLEDNTRRGRASSPTGKNTAVKQSKTGDASSAGWVVASVPKRKSLDTADRSEQTQAAVMAARAALARNAMNAKRKLAVDAAFVKTPNHDIIMNKSNGMDVRPEKAPHPFSQITERGKREREGATSATMPVQQATPTGASFQSDPISFQSAETAAETAQRVVIDASSNQSAVTAAESSQTMSFATSVQSATPASAAVKIADLDRRGKSAVENDGETMMKEELQVSETAVNESIRLVDDVESNATELGDLESQDGEREIVISPGMLAQYNVSSIVSNAVDVDRAAEAIANIALTAADSESERAIILGQQMEYQADEVDVMDATMGEDMEVETGTSEEWQAGRYALRNSTESFDVEQRTERSPGAESIASGVLNGRTDIETGDHTVLEPIKSKSQIAPPDFSIDSTAALSDDLRPHSPASQQLSGPRLDLPGEAPASAQMSSASTMLIAPSPPPTWISRLTTTLLDTSDVAHPVSIDLPAAPPPSPPSSPEKINLPITPPQSLDVAPSPVESFAQALPPSRASPQSLSPEAKPSTVELVSSVDALPPPPTSPTPVDSVDSANAVDIPSDVSETPTAIPSSIEQPPLSIDGPVEQHTDSGTTPENSPVTNSSDEREGTEVQQAEIPPEPESFSQKLPSVPLVVEEAQPVIRSRTQPLSQPLTQPLPRRSSRERNRPREIILDDDQPALVLPQQQRTWSDDENEGLVEQPSRAHRSHEYQTRHQRRRHRQEDSLDQPVVVDEEQDVREREETREERRRRRQERRERKARRELKRQQLALHHEQMAAAAQAEAEAVAAAQSAAHAREREEAEFSDGMREEVILRRHERRRRALKEDSDMEMVEHDNQWVPSPETDERYEKDDRRARRNRDLERERRKRSSSSTSSSSRKRRERDPTPHIERYERAPERHESASKRAERLERAAERAERLERASERAERLERMAERNERAEKAAERLQRAERIERAEREKVERSRTKHRDERERRGGNTRKPSRKESDMHDENTIRSSRSRSASAGPTTRSRSKDMQQAEYADTMDTGDDDERRSRSTSRSSTRSRSTSRDPERKRRSAASVSGTEARSAVHRTGSTRSESRRRVPNASEREKSVSRRTKTSAGSRRRSEGHRRKSDMALAHFITPIYRHPNLDDSESDTANDKYIPWYCEGQSDPEDASGDIMKCLYIAANGRTRCSHARCESRRKRRRRLYRRARHVAFMHDLTWTESDAHSGRKY